MSEGNTERSFSIGLLGANHELTKLVGEALGSPGTVSDLQFYNRLDNAMKCVFTAVAPIAYPDKIKPLVQVCSLCDIQIMIIDCELGITPEIGELMVLMDIYAQHFGSKYIGVIGNINEKTEWQLEQIQKQLPQLIGKTTIKDMEFIPLKNREDYANLKKKISEIGFSSLENEESDSSSCQVLIDHTFPVKGVGCVILGLVKKGTLKAGEMYDLIPIHEKPKRIILRSIQKQDRDYKTANQGDRVGLALKGVKAEEIDRNTMLCTLDAYKTSDKIKAEIDVSPYYKPVGIDGVISSKENKTYHIISELGNTPVKLIEGDEIKPGNKGVITLELEKCLPHDKDGLRGVIVDLGPFTKNLRIIGYFQQV
jgi:selenocysteine-specific elongation factor